MSEENQTLSALRDHAAILQAKVDLHDIAEAKMSGSLAAEIRNALESKELFRLLVDSVRDYAIFILGVDGTVQTWNSGAERIKGYTAHEIIGSHFSRFYPEEDVRAGKCELELEAAARVGRFEDEGWRVRKDGSRFWANVVISRVVDGGGTIIGFSKVTRDLTERRLAEEERTARVAAEHANRMKDEFLAMLGHELRNPLAPIVTALQLMKLRGATQFQREQEIIERQVKHMRRLVDDLLDVSGISRGKIVLKLQTLDVADIVAKAIEIASPLLEQRHQHLEIELPAGVLVVEGDEARLTQVFANLLTNAAKYTELNGHIWVEMSQVDQEIVVEVRDDGIGIEPALLANVFDLFVQGYQSSERAVGGLGLGLTLVRSIVDLHHGQVTARSPGRGLGCCFTVRLPATIRRVDKATTDPITQLVPGPTQRRVLIVDDNEDALMLLCELVAAAGHVVKAAGDAVVALAAIREFQPDVAVLDIGLPGMDGYELGVRLRAELGAAAPRLIALTGYGQAQDHARSQDAGFEVHLVKPVDVRLLLRRIASSE